MPDEPRRHFIEAQGFDPDHVETESKDDAARHDVVDVERLRARRLRGGFGTRHDYDLRGGERRGPRG